MYIKDIVYGDIEIPEKFQAVIDTPEFQRLRRIKQLATANLVFPGANHTRFEHCIGTFHIMKKIADHFIIFFRKLDEKISFNENDIDAILMAALLHDAGHGPFSHAFEQALGNRFDHEEMTCRIITSKDTEINKKLRKYFGDDFPGKVADYIDLRNEYKGNSQTGEGNKLLSDNANETLELKYKQLNNSFLWIFRQLVSSQLDADRIDYIIRDARETGVSFGNFSAMDLIEGMQITFFRDNYFVCIPEKYLSHVESYLYARYQMYRNIYMDSYKLFTEELLKRVLGRAKDLYSSEKNFPGYMPAAVSCLLNNTDLSIMDFCRLDDHVIMSAIQEWTLCTDKILSLLSKSFLDRTGFKKLLLFYNTEDDVKLFKKEFLSLCFKHCLDIPVLSNDDISIFEKFFFWIENTRYYSVYDKNSAKIYIQCNSGLVKEFTEVSSFITDSKEIIRVCYISFELLRVFFEENKKKEDDSADGFIAGVEKLIDLFSLRKQLEIESKYIVGMNDDTIFSDIKNFVHSRLDYAISEPMKYFQRDEYYDYSNFHLNKSGKSIRIRSKDGTCVATYKKEIDNFDEEQNANQTIRIEKEVDTDTADILTCWPMIVQLIPDIASVDPSQLNTILVIENNREKYILKKNELLLEMVFDDVTYHHGPKAYRERQVEIELKSSYEYRISLKMIAEMLEAEFGNRIQLNFQSKLERGLSLAEVYDRQQNTSG
jgi:HD superfamily phosphohydrolase/uncharacterized protein YjbK